MNKPYGPFTLSDSDSDEVSDSDNITTDSYGIHTRIGSRIGIGSVSVNRQLRGTETMSISQYLKQIHASILGLVKSLNTISFDANLRTTASVMNS